MFDGQVMAQDRAAITQVGTQIEQVLLAIPDKLYPERHDLHISACTGFRDGVFAESAFDLNHAEHELRIEAGPRTLILHGTKKVVGGGLLGNMFLEPL